MRFFFIDVANYEQRKVLAFAILDEDDDGMITEEDFETLIRVAMTVGWCYDTKMYKQTSKWPPDFVVKDPKVRFDSYCVCVCVCVCVCDSV
jgi:hypothetical protein